MLPAAREEDDVEVGVVDHATGVLDHDARARRIELGRSHLGIGRDPAGPDPADFGARRPLSLWIYVDDCDATIDALRVGGVPVDEAPIDQPWGERVARVRDPDGNEVIVGSRPGDPR